ncbi:MAG: hypothetical protein P0Y64_00395 [Candidatus Sphingomonas colombiensis]|nr:hypothetical protein [Sphingomonas sp.]WEK43360.1 MAG: hypothetical protein P0Y64_00395 [Sphingomonas sp.]
MTNPLPPLFADFAPPIREQTPLRQAITAAYRRPETECLPPLLAAAKLAPASKQDDPRRAQADRRRCGPSTRAPASRGWCRNIRSPARRAWRLMCLAEALLRIPDTATRDALIRDKIADGDWKSHVGGGKSLFVNAATWGLVVTGKLTSTVNDRSLAAALTRLIARAGEPVIRRGVDMAMRMMGEQFVTGETIDEALKRARRWRRAASAIPTTCSARPRRPPPMPRAITATTRTRSTPSAGRRGRGVYEGPGISIKLSALHPRYARAQAGRVMSELLPRVQRSR